MKGSPVDQDEVKEFYLNMVKVIVHLKNVSVFPIRASC